LPGGSGMGGVPLPGGGGGMAGVPLPGGMPMADVPLPGGGGMGGVPLPGGGGMPMGGGASSSPFPAAADEDDPFAAMAPPAPSRGSSADADPFAVLASPPPAAAPRPAPGNFAPGTQRSEYTQSTPFHGDSHVGPAPASPAAPAAPAMGAGVLDFIDREAASADRGTRKGNSFRIRKRSGKQVGPYDTETLLAMLRSHELAGTEEASEDGAVWKPLSSIPVFAEEIQRLMASALGGLGDLPAVPGGGKPAAATSSGLDLAATPGGLAGALEDEPVRHEPTELKKKPTKQLDTKGKFPVGLLIGAVGLVSVVGVGVVTEFVFPDVGAFGRKKLAGLFASDKPVEAPTPVVEAPKPKPVLDGVSLDQLLNEDNLASYQEAQKQLRAALDGGNTDAALQLARALALPAFLDNQPALADEALQVLEKATGADAKAVAAVKAFALLAKGNVDEALKTATAAASSAAPDVKDLSDAARQGESDAQTAVGYAMLKKGAKPEEILPRFDWAMIAWPNNLLASVGQARALHLSGDDESALGYLDRAVAMRPDNLRARLLAGEILMKKRKWRAAKEHLQAVVGSAGSKGTNQQRADAHVMLSDIALAEREFKEATEHIKGASSELPGDLSLKLRTGELYLRLRDWPQARTIFDEVLAGQPDNDDALIGSARAKIGATDALTAFKQLQDATQKKPQSAKLRYWYGVASEAMGKTPDAVNQYKQAQVLDPKRADPSVALARLQMEERKYAEALTLLQEARGRVAPEEEPWLRAMLAQVYVKQRNLPLAFKEFEAALDAAPGHYEARAWYGAALRDAGKFDSARKQLQEALADDPRNAMILAEMGSYFHSQGQYERAIDYFQQAIGISPKEDDYYVRMGAATFSKGDQTGALEFLKTAQSLGPNNPDVFYWMGLAIRKTDPEKAKSLFTRGTELAPEDGRFDHEMGRTLANEGQFIDAIQYLRAAIQKDPSNGEAYFDLGKCLVEQARHNEAREQFELALQKMPSKAYIRLNIAKAHADVGNYKPAQQEYLRAIQQDPTLTDAYCKLGDVYRNDTKNKEAVKMYEKCVEQKPSHKEAWKWLGYSYEALGAKFHKKAIEAWQSHMRVNREDPENDDLRDKISDMKGGN
ncbi:MAG: tetratricopeptide repeat protein, partial [Myxococcota bacterium]